MSEAATSKQRRRFEYPVEGPVMEWWSGIYDRVFVALNPFATFNLKPDENSERATLRWAEVARILGGVDFPTLARAADMQSCGAYFASRSHSETEFAVVDRLNELCVCAWADSISPDFGTALGSVFGQLPNTTALTARDYVSGYTGEISIGDLNGSAWCRTPHLEKCPYETNAFVKAIHDPNFRILVISELDTIWSFIALTSEAAKTVQIDAQFEGFWLDSRTTMRWIEEPGTYAPPTDWPQ